MSVRKARKRISDAARNAGVSCIKKRESIERAEAMVAVGWIDHLAEVNRKRRAQRRAE